MLLSDMGAEVVKVEPPAGDALRSERGERVNSSINVMSLSLRPVMGLRLDKVVAPDTHFSGSSDEPSPFVNIEFHQTFVSHFQ